MLTERRRTAAPELSLDETALKHTLYNPQLQPFSIAYCRKFDTRISQGISDTGGDHIPSILPQYVDSAAINATNPPKPLSADVLAEADTAAVHDVEPNASPKCGAQDKTDKCLTTDIFPLEQLSRSIVTLERVFEAASREPTVHDALEGNSGKQADPASVADTLQWGEFQLDEQWEACVPEATDPLLGTSLLGRGTYGVVSRLRHKPTGGVFAVKSIDKRAVVESFLATQVENEMRFQIAARHPNILRCYGYIEDTFYVHMFMECCDKGDLYQRIKARPTRRFEEAEVFLYFMQLVNGLSYIHSQGCFHRDLKLENLLIGADSNETLRIADFGWIGRILGVNANRNFCGTLDYLCPEMIYGSGHDWRTDIWGAGILLYEMFVGTPPFHSLDAQTLITNILTHQIRFPKIIPPDACDLIRDLLHPDPEQRIPLSAILKNSWIQKTWAVYVATTLYKSTVLFHSKHSKYEPTRSKKSTTSTTAPRCLPETTIPKRCSTAPSVVQIPTQRSEEALCRTTTNSAFPTYAVASAECATQSFSSLNQDKVARFDQAHNDVDTETSLFQPLSEARKAPCVDYERQLYDTDTEYILLCEEPFPLNCALKPAIGLLPDERDNDVCGSGRKTDQNRPSCRANNVPFKLSFTTMPNGSLATLTESQSTAQSVVIEPCAYDKLLLSSTPLCDSTVTKRYSQTEETALHYASKPSGSINSNDTLRYLPSKRNISQFVPSTPPLQPTGHCHFQIPVMVNSQPPAPLPTQPPAAGWLYGSLTEMMAPHPSSMMKNATFERHSSMIMNGYPPAGPTYSLLQQQYPSAPTNSIPPSLGYSPRRSLLKHTKSPSSNVIDLKACSQFPSAPYQPLKPQTVSKPTSNFHRRPLAPNRTKAATTSRAFPPRSGTAWWNDVYGTITLQFTRLFSQTPAP